MLVAPNIFARFSMLFHPKTFPTTFPSYPNFAWLKPLPIGSMYGIYIVTFTINIPPMLPYIAYMDPMGYDTPIPHDKKIINPWYKRPPLGSIPAPVQKEVIAPETEALWPLVETHRYSPDISARVYVTGGSISIEQGLGMIWSLGILIAQTAWGRLFLSRTCSVGIFTRFPELV